MIHVRVRNPGAVRACLNHVELSDAAFARQLELSPARFSQIANGKSRATLNVAQRIETALGVPPGSLFVIEGGPAIGAYVEQPLNPASGVA